jgi:hypothetical protein
MLALFVAVEWVKNETEKGKKRKFQKNWNN